MKKLLCLFLAMILCGCSSQQAPTSNDTPEKALTSGTYTASQWGNNGEITVEVSIKNNAITEVTVKEHKESKGISVYPLEVIPQQIVEYQSVGVDLISGATMTSLGVINAVKDCLEQADADLNAWSISPIIDYGTVQDEECDVVVIGSGAAGMTAAIAAAEQGAKVILVEKQDILGGTSLLSNSMFGSVQTSVHQAEGKTETVTDLIANYMKQEAATGAYAKKEAATVLAENSAAAAEYLIGIGVPLDHTSSAFILAPEGGSGLGSHVIPALTQEMIRVGVDVRTGTKATEILAEENTAAGVVVTSKAGTYTITSDAVIVATGGYAANRSMVSEYLPEWSNSIYYCSPGNTGDGLAMVEQIGVELVEMDIMKANPLVFYDRTRALTMNAAVGAGAIMVNHEGVRFANEQGSYSISPLINQQSNGEGIVLFDNTLVESNDTIKSYLASGYLTEADSLEELAAVLDINEAALLSTVSAYQEMVAAGEDTLFSRKTLADFYSGEKFYGIIVKPSIQGTFGGIPTNLNGEVLTGDGTVFEGLFAAGECAQEGINGLNPMTANVVFGKIAGTNAANFSSTK